MDKDKIPLSDYAGNLPFATMQDFSGEGNAAYREMMPGTGFNGIREWSDWLAPRCIEYAEHALITLSDGRILDGGLYIDYYETANPAIAETLAGECFRVDKSEKNYEYMQAPELDADYIEAYYNDLHFPTIIVRNGNIVVRAFFYQTSENYTVEFEQWASIIVNSITG